MKPRIPTPRDDSSLDEASLITLTCMQLIDSGKYLLAWVGVPEHDDNFSVRAVASAGHTEYLENLKLSWRGPNSYNSAVSVAILLGTVQVATYTTPSDNDGPASNNPKLAIRSSCALPIITNEGVIAALAVYANTKDAFQTRELIELRAVADDLAFEIQTLRDRKKSAGGRELAGQSMRQTHLGIFAIDVDTTQVFLLTNEMYNILGISGEGWDGSIVDFLHFVPPVDREYVESTLREVTTTGHSEFVLHVLRSNGELRTLQVVAEVAPGDGEDSNQIVCTCIDVTSSLDALEQLFLSPTTPTNERNADVVSGVTNTAISSLMTVHWPSSAVRRNEVEQVVLSDILNCLEDAIVSIDLDGRVTSWNRGAELLYGVSYEQAFAASVQEVLPSIAEDLFAVLNEDSAVALEQAEVKRTRRDGQHVLVEETISPIRNVTGRVIGALSRARSLAQLKETERELDSTRRELELRNRRLEASNAELERFAFVTSRDLAEPLRAITGMVSLLERKYHDQLDQDANEYLRYTTKACGRLRAMITNLQSFSSSGSGKLQTETIELVRALDAAVSNLVLDLEHFEAEIMVGDLALVRADRTMLIQVFENILRHALAMREDGDKFIIEVASTEAPNGFTKVSISDRSTGVDDGRPVSAVQMLQRPHVRNDFSSTGIDLAIAARIVDAHGGSFGSTGGLNDGSAIWFTLETAKDSSA